MGKGTIISGGEKGRYTILAGYNTERYNGMIGTIDAEKAELEEAKAGLEEKADAKAVEVASAASDLKIIVSELESLYTALSGYQGQMPGFISEKLALLDSILSQGGGNTGNDIVLGMADIEDIDEHLGQSGNYESTLAKLEAELAELVAKQESAEYGSPQWSNLADEIVEKQGEIEAIEKKLDTLDRLSGEKVLLEATVTENKDAADDLSPEETLGTDLIAVQESIFETQTNIDTTTAAIGIKNEAMTIAETIAQGLYLELQALADQIVKAEFYITTLEKRREWITNNAWEGLEIEVWCADFTEDLTGDVGTIEVPGELGTIQIWPGYDDAGPEYDEDRDGQLFGTASTTPAQAFYNLAMMPGWQKWNPTFRYAVIDSVDYENDTANITLDEAKSSQQDLNINQEEMLTGVPIEYMDCDSDVFKEGDAVLVMFTDQKFSQPKIIGFKTNPMPCIRYIAYRSYLQTIGYTSYFPIRTEPCGNVSRPDGYDRDRCHTRHSVHVNPTAHANYAFYGYSFEDEVEDLHIHENLYEARSYMLENTIGLEFGDVDNIEIGDVEPVDMPEDQYVWYGDSLVDQSGTICGANYECSMYGVKVFNPYFDPTYWKNFNIQYTNKYIDDDSLELSWTDSNSVSRGEFYRAGYDQVFYSEEITGTPDVEFHASITKSDFPPKLKYNDDSFVINRILHFAHGEEGNPTEPWKEIYVEYIKEEDAT